jgi:hypothetical protein
MSTKRIYLIPETPDVPVAPEDKLLEHLRTIGLTGDRIERFPGSFWHGARFIDLMGLTSKSKDGRYAITVATLRDMEIVGSAEVQYVRPTCRCGVSLESWEDALSVTPWTKGATNSTVTCSVCGLENYPWEWNWNHRLGFARQYIQVDDVLSEPTSELLGSLGSLTDSPWTYLRYHM